MTISAPNRMLDFGNPAALDAGLSAMAHGLRGSVILRIGAEVRALAAAGQPLCNLTVGDFDPRQFPVPVQLRDHVMSALAAGETNYPPSDGMPALREAVVEYVAREHGISLPLGSVLITAGGRPAIYAAYRCILDPQEAVLYSVPSWNNDYYAGMLNARELVVRACSEHAFQPTADELRPHLASAKLLCLCSPGNPTGTVLEPHILRSILETVVQENERRGNLGRSPLFVLHDLMYGSLVFGDLPHAHPLALVPEAAPFVVTVDGISKAFAGTGLRVGWATAAPAVIARMKDFLGHVGAWAPRPEQIATAAFLRDPESIARYRQEMHQALVLRLEALYSGFTALKLQGHPVECVRPQGAMYVSLQLDLVERVVGDVRLNDNEELRKLLLERAGLAAVPFQAFGLAEETGWFRLSVGAVSIQDIEEMLPRVKSLLETVAAR
jgi:aspartate aminotransferase